MRRKIVITAIAGLVLAAAATVLLASKDTVRQPAVADAFYPGNAAVLTSMVNGFLERAKVRQENGRLVGLIAPHAGYVYSGQVAAHAYRHIADRPVDLVILVGASHHESYAGAVVYPDGLWRTPLGEVRINGKVAGSLLNEKAGVTANREYFSREHSLEVQVPFLQRTLQGFTIVPILMGAPTRESFAHLADRLTGLLRANDRAIIIASSDLSHYHDYDAAKALDRRVIAAAGRMSVEDLEALLGSGQGEACGGFPVLLTMLVSRNLGATHGVLYDAKNSGDVTGDRSRVVGYASMGLYRSGLSEEQRAELLRLAKRTVDQYVRKGTAPEPDSRDPRLTANGATFVTLNRSHRLRGCIGNIQPTMPLDRSVVANAVSAAARDPRFPPLRQEELKDLEVEVTVLSPLEPLGSVKDIRIGTHGLYLMKDGRNAVFLPQVPVEQGWDLKTYLGQLCAKAGLPEDAWKERDAKLFIFTADVVK